MVKQTNLHGEEVELPVEKKESEEVCVCCKEKLAENADVYPAKEGMLCFGCYESETSQPPATVIYGKDEDERKILGDYIDETDGEFVLSYHKTDGWRGYYEVASKIWTNVHSDAILAHSEDAGELENFDEKLQELLDAQNISYARVFTRTSNIFCSGYDFFVKKEDAQIVQALVFMLRAEYRDPERFSITALTGDYKKDKNEKKLLKAYEMIQAGKSEKEVYEAVMN